MEKYSRFRDEATGIAPFQAVRPPSASFNWFETVVIFLFSAISVPVAVVGLLNYFLLGAWILPVVVSRLLLSYTVLLPLRVLYVSFSYDGERRASVRKRDLKKAQPGDVLVSNFESPLDPLIYATQHKSVFVFPTADGQFEQVSMAGAACRALGLGINIADGVSLNVISLAARKSGAVVVLFAEGTASNGRGLLTLKHANFRDIAGIDGHVYASAIRYSPGSATSPTPTSVLSYVWHISRASWWYMASVKISGEPLAKSTITKDEVSKAIGGLGRLRLLGDKLDATSKEEFYKQLLKKR